MKNILLILLAVFTTSIYAQMPKSSLPKPGTITGKVVDQITKQPLPYVNIIIKDAAKKIITGGITDDNGLFSIKNIPEGNSIVEVQFIGYKTFSKPISVSRKSNKVNLGTISLEEDSTTLDEVEIRAETSSVTQKVDRKVINVGKDLTSAGATASELLNNVQSVSVDSQSGNISLRGNENVRVLVDGKPTNIPASELLKQIPSTSIKSVELITNPSAKYNPEGMSGIINIILNKNANMGFNGSINTGVEAGHYVRYNASTNMNYKTGKVNFFGNYGFNGGDRYNFGYVNRPGVNNQDFIFTNDNESHLFKIGADIYLDDKNTLSLYTTQNWFDSNASGRAIITDNNGDLIEHSPNTQTSESHNQAYNVNYKHDFDKEGHSIEFEANYSKNNAPNYLNNYFFEGTQPDYFNDINNNRKSTLLNLDYTNPISKNGKLELGLEYRVNSTGNINLTNQQIVLQDINGNETFRDVGDSYFSYDRDIYSAYVNYGHQFGKLSMQLGARFEQYEIEGNFTGLDENGVEKNDKVTDDIFSVYPSAFFTYNPNDDDQFQLSYSKRVDRPGIQQVNPIREWSTPLITSVGNPDLVPQFTNSVEFNYTRKIKGGSITLGSFYRNITDVMNRATYMDPLDETNTRQILTFANFDDTDAYGLEFSASYKIAKWWRANASMDYYSQKQFGTTDLSDPNAPTTEVKTDIFNARISNSFTISKKLRLQLFAMYRGPREDIQWNVEPMKMVNVGANYSILKGKGNINFRVNDIFNDMRFKFNSERPFVQNGRFKWESRTAYIGFNYRFGGGKNKARSRKQRDNNEKQGGGGFL
ncbi:outer membrane receptor protein involved in Fe transport [Tenacibaculum gallaicum]|uniref:Outer membrane receptor protein involved in Fe transport n=1 Tax=Tenacibaculum gallaicum TaxID=561505 RepID=A0A3E0I183_9FLAO|nr:TonB-dependent receptor [Tenacibaculum gallaicum]REH52479.1 outer membrane receptor protein involved in Fe transport [Tenacibaculum gallaicum]